MKEVSTIPLRCPSCGQTKEGEQFARGARQGWSCKQCMSERHREVGHSRKSRISLSDVQRMYEAQSGLCECCGVPITMKSLKVDHNHSTGNVRALVCNRCNIAIGYYELGLDHVENYLERFRYF